MDHIENYDFFIPLEKILVANLKVGDKFNNSNYKVCLPFSGKEKTLEEILCFNTSMNYVYPPECIISMN